MDEKSKNDFNTINNKIYNETIVTNNILWVLLNGLHTLNNNVKHINVVTSAVRDEHSIVLNLNIDEHNAIIRTPIIIDIAGGNDFFITLIIKLPLIRL